MKAAAAAIPDPAKPCEQNSPPVTSADDRDWFATRPQRRYRVRSAANGYWLVRRRSGGVFLRTWTAILPKELPDTDKALRLVWFDAAWPDLTARERAELVRQASHAEKSAAGA